MSYNEVQIGWLSLTLMILLVIILIPFIPIIMLIGWINVKIKEWMT